MSNLLIKYTYFHVAELIGSTPATLRKWEKTGELLPTRKTKAGTCYYSTADLLDQQEVLETYCAAKGWRTQTIRDLGSGMNYNKKGLRLLLEMILRRQMKQLVLTHKDRLLRFGADLVFTLCDLQGIEIVIIHQGDPPSFEEELVQDVLELVTVFSARLYGSRSHKAKKMIDTLTEYTNNQQLDLFSDGTKSTEDNTSTE